MRHLDEAALWTHEVARLEPDYDPDCAMCGEGLTDTNDECESCGTPRPEREREIS